MVDLLSGLLVFAGAGFFLAGSVGLLRLPDVYSRLHALTKADNVGLGLLAAGLLLRAPDPLEAVQLVLVWLLALVSGAAGAHLIAQFARRRERGRWSP
jgi:multicomponent Na+:H+ antiporter subunit G